MELETIVALVGSVGFPIVGWFVINKQVTNLQEKILEIQRESSERDKEVTVAITNNTNAIVNLTEYIKGQRGVDDV